jgi:hypothetical protein
VICDELGSCKAASSSSVTLTPTMSSEPPASDQTFASWPPGPTSSMSMPSGHVWLAPSTTRSRSVIVPEKPEAVQVDG